MFDLTRVASRKVTRVGARGKSYVITRISFLLISSNVFTFVLIFRVLIFCPTDTERGVPSRSSLLVKESRFHLKARFFIFTRDFHFGRHWA